MPEPFTDVGRLGLRRVSSCQQAPARPQEAVHREGKGGSGSASAAEGSCLSC
eukprot:CAMPEP_0178439352 /NCGR_PEP_ID=MMETSP0689_2-20121128/36110_1 /TAXON_ID=160604 /ORGANISM="Amphidinium massartii, Strain CS-259" /LENGTH=51 /DNA_ID=CAMNT_0020061875 /DNA_START=777 /DNA_END=932 /DNA_ORIENTATION=+